VIKRALLAVPVAAVIFAGTALALPSVHDYNGHVKGDPSPGSGVAFSVDRAEGHRVVFNIDASGLDYECDEGPPDDTAAVSFEGDFRVHRDGTFGGKSDVTIGVTDPPGKFEGKLKGGGKATGKLRIHGELDPEGRPGVDCNTGVLRWKASKN
jgi:hypothetical protein